MYENLLFVCIILFYSSELYTYAEYEIRWADIKGMTDSNANTKENENNNLCMSKLSFNKSACQDSHLNLKIIISAFLYIKHLGFFFLLKFNFP